MREELEQKIHEFAVNAEVLYKTGYEDGYKAGYEGRCLLTDEECLADQKRQYERGLNDAWECARKIVLGSGYSRDELIEIFGVGEWTVLETVTALEAVTKIKEYEEKRKQQTDDEIKVGDEVILPQKIKSVVTNIKSVVTNVSKESNTAVCLYGDGGECVFVSANTSSLTKTGRHFPQIAGVLISLQDRK